MALPCPGGTDLSAYFRQALGRRSEGLGDGDLSEQMSMFTGDALWDFAGWTSNAAEAVGTRDLTANRQLTGQAEADSHSFPFSCLMTWVPDAIALAMFAPVRVDVSGWPLLSQLNCAQHRTSDSTPSD
jgi:hypothetical protein